MDALYEASAGTVGGVDAEGFYVCANKCESMRKRLVVMFVMMKVDV